MIGWRILENGLISLSKQDSKHSEFFGIGLVVET